MADITVDDITVGAVLEKLRKGEWMVPQFQREFVWSNSEVESLVESIFQARPIGMVTLWEQADNQGLDLEHISLPDTGTDDLVYFKNDQPPPNRRYAILDGRQRSTALAMAFGGLRSKDFRRKHAGQFFLSLREEDEYERVQFIKSKDIVKTKLDSDSGALSQGLVPLALPEGAELMSRWMQFVQLLTDEKIYPGGELPPEEILERRNQILMSFFEGLSKTRLAVYVVPPEYSLGDICEIFETLNTTGTKVSTVDLIHSWLYSDSQGGDDVLLLRDWLSDMSAVEGAAGWLSAEQRPELAAQLVTACFIALEKRHKPRAFSGKPSAMNSVKAGDLLGTPTQHWRDVMKPEHSDKLAEFLRDFQFLVAGGLFPATRAPYPASAAIYVALRWHHEFDGDDAEGWSLDQLNSVFRAFYWRNALSSRYDQGFLTQVGADIRGLKKLLSDGAPNTGATEWIKFADERLEALIDKSMPEVDELTKRATDGSTAGAMRSALRLRMLARAEKDILDPALPLHLGANSDVELHHIFPSKWCKTNRDGEIARLLDEKDEFGHDWLGSTANLMPLSKNSNLYWRDKKPAQALNDRDIEYASSPASFEQVYIDETAFNLLTSPSENDHSEVSAFWKHRARLIAEDMLKQTTITL